ncbi:MAG: hypothetical protein JNN25_11005 [Candidatus Kapabacteria bacterium]|nr:hypothetical protein [Candidatus Kapabacteria bacterium]
MTLVVKMPMFVYFCHKLFCVGVGLWFGRMLPISLLTNSTVVIPFFM